MKTFQLLKFKLLVSALAILWLVSACSPQASTTSSEATVPHLDDLVRAASTGSTEDLQALIQFSSLPCTKAEGLGGPPRCLDDEPEGTLVEVLPVLGPEGHHIRRSEISSMTSMGGAQLYAAFRTPESTFSDEFFPAGEYGVAFLLPDNANVVIFQVTDEGIVRMDYHPLSSVDDILEEAEIILRPTQPSE